jgi:hypothetical protein
MGAQEAQEALQILREISKLPADVLPSGMVVLLKWIIGLILLVGALTKLVTKLHELTTATRNLVRQMGLRRWAKKMKRILDTKRASLPAFGEVLLPRVLILISLALIVLKLRR